ncbi:peptide ligase PGM1-related protein [Cyanobium sp. Morenito 9A2]|uniref:peptide ligase PGM1-related protein n=1 Tax=Cyanobium sp. Morenito 9A2 TaxID=2823718 RepID=UPI0020CF62F3|nr:peptide ligase PGM1-related protein [Cyanobium sp. Morenito 9A2]MCP9848361.1 carboxylate-amine ligase [Cyanobium sp. Morenito 9A2]
MALSFQELQQTLRRRSPMGGDADEASDLLVVPSLSFEPRELALVSGAHHYEERQLFELMRLRNPATRMTYLSSTQLPELVVEAVLELVPGMPASHARRRLTLFDTSDASSRSLTAKLLERPVLLRRIRESLRPERCVISCFMVTALELELSERLQIPLLGTDPALAHWGSKEGGRRLFARCGVPHPPGSERVHDLDALAEACAALWEADPALERVVVKLNEGFSGEGNACLDLAPLPLAARSAAGRRRLLRQALEDLPMPAAEWRELLVEQGALVEAWLQGGEVRSPSVQGTIHPDGTVEVLSSHEQVLGGPGGQTYLGCRFPADGAYRLELHQHGRVLGEALAAEGALGRYAVDFVARRQGGLWELQAIEINLRQGGTTHPYLALRSSTNGRLDPRTGLFHAPTGQALFYEATDNFCDPSLKGLLPIDLIDIACGAGLNYDPAELRGSVFHLLGCLSEFGKLGLTSMGRSPEEAAQLHARTTERLVRAAQELQAGTLVG